MQTMMPHYTISMTGRQLIGLIILCFSAGGVIGFMFGAH
jgi:hypothetical protein